MAAASRQLFRESLPYHLRYGLPQNCHGMEQTAFGLEHALLPVRRLAPPKRKEHVLTAGYDNTVRTLIYSGRPMSVRKTPYVAEWEPHRQREIETLVSQGKIPHEVELEKQPDKSLEGRMCRLVMYSFILSDLFYLTSLLGLMGNVVGSINVVPSVYLFGSC
jgi:hypothetical protein